MSGILDEEYTEIRRRPLSANPADNYLDVVLFMHNDEQGRYATALYNSKARGFFSGHYDLSYAGALKDFQERR